MLYGTVLVIPCKEIALPQLFGHPQFVHFLLLQQASQKREQATMPSGTFHPTAISDKIKLNWLLELQHEHLITISNKKFPYHRTFSTDKASLSVVTAVLSPVHDNEAIINLIAFVIKLSSGKHIKTRREESFRSSPKLLTISMISTIEALTKAANRIKSPENGFIVCCPQEEKAKVFCLTFS